MKCSVICNKQTLYPCSGNTMLMSSDPQLLPTSQVGYNDLHVCYICSRQFNRKGNLNRHLKFHTEVLIKDMNQFGVMYTCASGSGGSTHLSQSQKYASSPPYICEVCNKPFTQKGNLNRHLKFHTGARPFVCRVCNRGFTLKQNLERHFRVHTGHRPYECKYCGKRFKQDTTLRSHYITHMKSF
ncbi:Protein suppressor of hairy wing, partial [Stegodyphus mimosarum]